MDSALTLVISMLTWICLQHASGGGVHAVLDTKPALSSDSCPEGWLQDNQLCFSPHTKKERCAASNGIYLLGICITSSKAVGEQRTAESTKEISLGVYFKAFKRFCCGHGFGRRR